MSFTTIEDISAKASKITVPVRVIVGGADTVEKEASLRAAFGKVIPSAEFVVLPGVGHMAHSRRPRSWSRRSAPFRSPDLYFEMA